MKKIVALVLIIGVGLWFYTGQQNPKKSSAADDLDVTAVDLGLPVKDKSPKKPKVKVSSKTEKVQDFKKRNKKGSSREENGSKESAPKLMMSTFSPTNEREKSLELLGSVQTAIFQEDLSPSNVYDRLKREGLKPERIESKDENIGNQYIVKSDVGPQGTRYFKAIYESDDHGNYIPVHSFFEFQKGDDAFQRANDLVRSQFSEMKIVTQRDDYTNYSLGNCRHAIVKTLNNWEDMKDHPDNGYKKSDIGTVQVSIETNPRCD